MFCPPFSIILNRNIKNPFYTCKKFKFQSHKHKHIDEKNIKTSVVKTVVIVYGLIECYNFGTLT